MRHMLAVLGLTRTLHAHTHTTCTYTFTHLHTPSHTFTHTHTHSLGTLQPPPAFRSIRACTDICAHALLRTLEASTYHTLLLLLWMPGVTGRVRQPLQL